MKREVFQVTYALHQDSNHIFTLINNIMIFHHLIRGSRVYAGGEIQDSLNLLEMIAALLNEQESDNMCLFTKKSFDHQ